MTKEAVPISGKVKKDLIEALLVSTKGIKWPLEMKMLNGLLKKYGNTDFWFFLAKRRKFISLVNLASQKNILLQTAIEYRQDKNSRIGLEIETPKSNPEQLLLNF